MLDLALSDEELQNLSLADLEELERELDRLDKHNAAQRFGKMFPDDTFTDADGMVYWARRLYAKHLEFFRVGAAYRERCFMAGNRVGKTFGGGGFEITAHLTGLYPPWWEGKRFPGPIRAWAAGETHKDAREIVQDVLLGEVAHKGSQKTVSGTGIIPGDLLGKPTWQQGVMDLVDKIKVKHVSGGWSVLGIKAYTQGRGSFQGTAMHVIWLDEEPPGPVYNECVIRTATTDGIVMLTFTPLGGRSDVVKSFLPRAGEK